MSVNVSNFARSKTFYRAALAPLGYAVVMEFENKAGFGIGNTPDFWIGEGKPNVPPVHVAFAAASHVEVDAFYRAAIAAGATDNGRPGPRPHYHEHYYGAFVRDPDGHNIEACCHLPE